MRGLFSIRGTMALFWIPSVVVLLACSEPSNDALLNIVLLDNDESQKAVRTLVLRQDFDVPRVLAAIREEELPSPEPEAVFELLGLIASREAVQSKPVAWHYTEVPHGEDIRATFEYLLTSRQEPIRQGLVGGLVVFCYHPDSESLYSKKIKIRSPSDGWERMLADMRRKYSRLSETVSGEAVATP